MYNDEEDEHEIRRTVSRGASKVSRWRDAWSACYQMVEELDPNDLRHFHTVFEKWVPILNWIFDSPISNLERYDPVFYYCTEPNGPKEILQLYFSENRYDDDHVTVNVIFNLHEFMAIHRLYVSNFSKSNAMLVNEARGTINMTSLEDCDYDPAVYFKNMTTWQLLFIFTCHALTHFEAYNTLEHAHYDDHLYARDSVFYKLHFLGQIVYRRN